MSDLDNELSRVLHDRADTMSHAPLGFDDVRGRATSIRRRRRIATGLAVAAAVAVIVPTAVLSTRGGGTDSIPPATATPTTVTESPQETPTSSPVMGADPHALDVSDLPTGAPPAIGYVPGSEGVTSYAQIGDHAVRVVDGGVKITGETPDEVFGPFPTSYGLAVNAAGTAAAWTTDDGDLMVWAEGATAPATLGAISLAGPQVSALTGSDCQVGASSDCTYYVTGHGDGDQPTSLMVNGDGTSRTLIPAGTMLAVRDATESGLLLGMTELSNDGSCSAAIDDAQTLLASCDYTFDSFSPDGSYVLASEPYHSGDSSGVIAVFATAGDRLGYRVRTGQQMAGYRQAVWEDDTHVLFTAYQDGAWSIVRMDVNGALEYAVPPVPGEDPYGPAPFVLETR